MSSSSSRGQGAALISAWWRRCQRIQGTIMNCETLQEYLDRYGALVADRARQAFEPLHVPATDAVVKLDLKRPMLPAQAHVVTAAVKTLDRQKAVFLCCECGTGKTQMGACTVHAHAAGKPYRAIVMCPPHLVETWRAELRQVFRQGTIEIQVLEKWRELLSYPRTKPTKPTWLIMGETVAKNGPYWRAAAIKDRRGVLRCPDCGAQLREKSQWRRQFSQHEGPGAVPKAVFGRNHRRFRQGGQSCHSALRMRRCGNTVKGQAIWAPADYIHKHMKGVFDYLIGDEVHEEKADTSARANALGALVASCRKVIGMTGTLIGGKASHVRSLLFRLSPNEPQGREPVVAGRHGILPAATAGWIRSSRRRPARPATIGGATAGTPRSGRRSSRESCPRCMAGT